MLDYHHDVDHKTQITSHDRDYRNVDVHEQAILSTKTEEKPSEKDAESKMLVHFFFLYDRSYASLFNRAGPLGVKEGRQWTNLKIFVQHPGLSTVRVLSASKRNAITSS